MEHEGSGGYKLLHAGKDVKDKEKDGHMRFLSKLPKTEKRDMEEQVAGNGEYGVTATPVACLGYWVLGDVEPSGEISSVRMVLIFQSLIITCC